MRKTERPERYVAYYRMPAIGDTPNGDTLAHQRHDMAAFLNHPDRVLVGEFTEVMAPAYEGETSPAFDLSLECCRSLDAKLICAVPQAELATAAQEKAIHEHVEIIMVGDVVQPTDARPEIQPKRETVPYLRFGPGRQRIRAPRLSRSTDAPLVGNRAKADQFAATIIPIIEQIKESGATTLTDIADVLNARNIRTARGTRWYPTTVKNILERHQ
jgi:hypothetical protein